MAHFRLKTETGEYPLAEGETLLGRAAECQVQIDHPLVSRRHARVVVTARQVLFEDLGSTHGSRINGERVHGARPFVVGDRLTIGVTDFFLQGPAQDRAPSVPSSTGEIELAVLISRLCGMGRVDEAERIARTSLERLAERVHHGDVIAPRAVNDAVERVLALAEATRNEEWSRALFDIAALLRYCLEDRQLDRIYGVLFVARPECGAAIEHYLRTMAPLEAQLNDQARYNLRRVAALRKLTTVPASQ